MSPIPWVPEGAFENLPAPRLQNASPRFHSAPLAPTAAHRQASRGPRGPRAAKCVTTHFCRSLLPTSLATVRPPPVLSVCHRASWGSWGSLAFRRAPSNNSRFLRSSHVFKALPLDAPPGPQSASHVPQTNRANSRREPQTSRNASSPQGIQGGGL